MNRFPTTKSPVCIADLAPNLEHEHAQPSRAFWFTVGFFSALTLAGIVSGLIPCP